MRTLLVAALIGIVAGGASAAEQAGDGFLPLPEGLVALDSPAGKSAFAEARNGPFWRLIQFYGIQPNLATCGVASCTMVLNALPIPRPEAPNHGEFKLYTPDNFFTPTVTAVVKREKVYQSGMSLQQLGKVLSTFPVESASVPADSITLDAFRDELKKCTADSGRLMLVNYLRKSLGQETGGHISPVGAYSTAEDLVLILDVSTYKYPWVWVKAENLFVAMGTNKGTHPSRGYVVVSAKGK